VERCSSTVSTFGSANSSLDVIQPGTFLEKGCNKTSYMLEKAAIEPVTLLMEVHLAHPSSTRGILCRPIHISLLHVRLVTKSSLNPKPLNLTNITWLISKFYHPVVLTVVFNYWIEILSKIEILKRSDFWRFFCCPEVRFLKKIEDKKKARFIYLVLSKVIRIVRRLRGREWPVSA